MNLTPGMQLIFAGMALEIIAAFFGHRNRWEVIARSEQGASDDIGPTTHTSLPGPGE